MLAVPGSATGALTGSGLPGGLMMNDSQTGSSGNLESVNISPGGYSGTGNDVASQSLPAAPASMNRAELSIVQDHEITSANNVILPGTYNARDWGSLIIKNTADSTHQALGNVTLSIRGNSFLAPEFPENAMWNTTNVNWTFPLSYQIPDNESLSIVYRTSENTTLTNPVTLSRYVNKSTFSTSGYQANMYVMTFDTLDSDSITARFAAEESLYSNSSILFDSFTTNLPLTAITNSSYLHPITNQSISEIYIWPNMMQLTTHTPYYVNFTINVKPVNNSGLDIRYNPRVFLGLTNSAGAVVGQDGFFGTMPEVLLPQHLANATVSTNVSNVWTYRITRQLKAAFNQTSELIPLARAANVGVFRSPAHMFYQDFNGNGAWNGASADKSYNFGTTGDIPVSGDWTNDGIEEIGVFRNTTHTFYLDYNGNGAWNGASTDRAWNFGITGDIPVSGDWNHDGISEIGVFRPSTHTFYLDYNGNGAWSGASADRALNFGLTWDLPVTGDWNHDGISKIGVFRPSTHTFYLDYNGNGAWSGASTDRAWNFGITGDIPVTGDWNHDGISEIGVFRPSTHTFYLDYNGNGAWTGAAADRAYNFGITSDKPLSGRW